MSKARPKSTEHQVSKVNRNAAEHRESRIENRKRQTSKERRTSAEHPESHMPHGKSKVEKKKNEHLTPKENRTSKENRNRIQPHGGYGGGGRATLALVLQKISRNYESTSIDSSYPANTRLCIDFLCCSKFVSLYRLFPCADYSDLHLPSFPFGLAFHSPLGRDLFRFST